MHLAGIDPSFHRTGISMFLGDKIVIDCRKTPANSDKSFSQVWNDANHMSTEVAKLLRDNGIEQVISEVPPPQGQFAPGLYCLDSLLFYKLKRIGVKRLLSLYPNYVGHVHGTRKYTKTQSVELAKDILEVLGNRVNIEILSGKLNHDEAESLIFLCRLLVINNVFTQELKPWKGLFSSKERELF